MDTTSAVRFRDDGLNVVVGNYVIDAVMAIDNGWDSEGAAGVDLHDEPTLKRCLQHLQNFHPAKKPTVTGKAVDVFVLETELVEERVASAPDAMKSDVTIVSFANADAWMSVRKEAEIVKAKLAEITKYPEETMETHIKKIEKVRKEHVEEIGARKATILESRKTIGRESYKGDKYAKLPRERIAAIMQRNALWISGSAASYCEGARRHKRKARDQSSQVS